MFVPVKVWTLILEKWLKEGLFLWNQSINVIYPNEKNVFMAHNHGKKGDYYMHPCLSQLTDEIWFQKTGGNKSFCYETKVSVSSIHMRRMCLWCLIINNKVIITCILICPNWWMNFDSRKMMERKGFLIKPKHQCHLSQWGKCWWCLIMKRKENITCIHVCHS